MGSPGIALSQTLPKLPVIGDISCGTSNGATIVATTAAEFRTALTTAVYGDTITLTAGANFVGPFTLPVKSGTGCITIRTSAPDSALPAAGARITPAYASVLPKILAPGANQNAVVAAYGSHNYKFIGIEFMTVNAAAVADSLILIGDGGMTSLTQVPHHYEFDRVYVHAWPTQTLKRGLYLNSASTTVKNSYVSDFKSAGQDTQAILIINGSGPFRITNNYLEASGENLLVGGGDPHIPNMVPSDIEIIHNYFSKPVKWRNPNVGATVPNPEWDGSNWSVKNILELKLGIRVLIDGNIFENCWVNEQIGWAVLFTVRNQSGNAPWSEVRDVTFTNNLIRHATRGIEMHGIDIESGTPSQLTKRVRVANNLWLDIGYPMTSGYGNGEGIGLAYYSDAGVIDDLTVEHNTWFHGGDIFSPGDHGTIKGLGLIWRNNIHPHNAYGVKGSNAGVGTSTLDLYFSGYVYTKNVMITNPDPELYPTGNFNAANLAAVGFTNVTDLLGTGSNYSLLPTSPYHNAGTDGTDIGVNWMTLKAATSTTYSGGTGSGDPPLPAPENLTVR
jgi:hypothetical protein